MSKWYEVKVTTVKVFAVEVEDDQGEEAAMEVALDYVSDFDEADCSDPITDHAILDSIKRHADEVLPL